MDSFWKQWFLILDSEGATAFTWTSLPSWRRIWCCYSVTTSCLTLWPHGLEPSRLPCPWASPGKNPGAGCHFRLQGIFWTQGSNSGLFHWQADSLPLSHWEALRRMRGSQNTGPRGGEHVSVNCLPKTFSPKQQLFICVGPTGVSVTADTSPDEPASRCLMEPPFSDESWFHNETFLI